MKTALILLFSIVPLLFAFAVSPVALYAQEGKVVGLGLYRLEGMGISEIEAKILTDILYTGISNIIHEQGAKLEEKYSLVERTQLDKAFEEFKLQHFGCTAEECAIEFGKMISAQQMIVGSVGLVGKTNIISLRIFDVESSKIIRSVSRKYMGNIDGVIDILPLIVKELLPNIPTPKIKNKVLLKSIFLPGSGQRYADDKRKGAVITVLQAATLTGVVGTTIIMIDAQKKYDNSYDEYKRATPEKITSTRADMNENWDKVSSASTAQKVLIGAAAAVYLYNIIDAVFTMRKIEVNPPTNTWKIEPKTNGKFSGVYAVLRF